jgi:hypothetical protein
MRGVPTPGTPKTGIPSVRWCREVFRSHGWTVREPEWNTGGERIYPVTTPEGLDLGLNTYGLRRIAREIHASKDSQRNFVHTS